MNNPEYQTLDLDHLTQSEKNDAVAKLMWEVEKSGDLEKVKQLTRLLVFEENCMLHLIYSGNGVQRLSKLVSRGPNACSKIEISLLLLELQTEKIENGASVDPE